MKMRLITAALLSLLAIPTLAATTLDPANKDASVALSNGNLTATNTTTNNTLGARATGFATAGKLYFEATVNASDGNTQNHVAIIKSTFCAGSYNCFPGGSAISYTPQTGDVYINTGSPVHTIQTTSPTQVVGVALDITGALVWFRPNGGNWNNDPTADPATGTGGYSVSAVSSGATLYPYIVVGKFSGSGQITANFGATAYSLSAPSGFGNWAGATVNNARATMMGIGAILPATNDNSPQRRLAAGGSR